MLAIGILQSVAFESEMVLGFELELVLSLQKARLQMRLPLGHRRKKTTH